MKGQLSINAIRVLGADMINKAKSGHPGILLGAAPFAYTLFTKHLNIATKNPNWISRDRFVLSAGHGTGLLYPLLHFIGYLSMDDLKSFRQLGSKTPGHPEANHTMGVDVTTGPLGQGIANAVGLAVAETYLNTYFEGLVDNFTYVLCGDGDLQEGIAQEAISLAGHLKLGKLIVLYDSNDIQLDGAVSNSNTENVKMKFESMGWQYIKVNDGNSITEIDNAIVSAKKELSMPTIIEIKTTIGFGATAQGTNKVHGAPIGEDIKNLRSNLEWEFPAFEIPNDVYSDFSETIVARGNKLYDAWEKQGASNPKSIELKDLINGKFLDFNYEIYDQSFEGPTRNVAQKAVEQIANSNKMMLGGSADLASSAMVRGTDGHYSATNRLGRDICFGVREHAMGAIINGISLYGLKSFCSAFFVFSDYLKPAMRMAALMEIPAMFYFSHDSIAVGEDGPTHQPIEQLIGLRSIPNMNVMRPCDANEMLFAVKIAYESVSNPSTVIMSRQKLKTLANTSYGGFQKGAYIIENEKDNLDAILVAAGSEVSIAIEAKRILESKGKSIRVVSMPSWFLFEKNSDIYKEEILPKGVKKIAIEMGSPYGWYKYADYVYGIDRFGVSAPAGDVLPYFGFTAEKIVEYFESISKD